MQAAEINWRPLGELFVEQGLINEDELEEALSEQRETKARLGQILVSRGLVSGRELTRVLVDQLGHELEKDGEPRLRVDGSRRKKARAEQGTLNGLAPPGLNGAPDTGDIPGNDTPPPASAFEAALAKEREDLEEALNERRAALQAVLAEAPIPPQADVPDLPPSAPEATHDSEDVAAAAREQMEALTARLAALETSFADERAQHRQALQQLEAERSGHRRVLQELDQARQQARTETTELRSSLEKLRSELARLDQTTSWFEYWSGSAALRRAEAGDTGTGTGD
jgi:hypothetical protein